MNNIEVGNLSSDESEVRSEDLYNELEMQEKKGGTSFLQKRTLD